MHSRDPLARNDVVKTGCLKSEVDICEAPGGAARIDSTRVIAAGAGPESILRFVVMDSRVRAFSAPRNDDEKRCAGSATSPRPSVAGVLRHIAVVGLLADVLFFVVAMA